MVQDIFLIGPMASGKSVVGRALADRLGYRFVDTDEEITAGHGSIAGLFAKRGEAAFRTVESTTLARAASREEPSVIATGGGVVLDPGNRDLLAGSFTVYLHTDLATVRPRIEADSGRPLLDGDPIRRWADILAERESLYRACASLTIDARTGSVARLAEDIEGAYRRHASTSGGITT
ncbi:MAG: shikimate kinase [Arthrobacter sp.]|uniref:shikimate kinase n=1 Tax=unclassified Arthrobacter TaxID=235627 RepID=UPI002652B93B|nr:shikimate kinase [Micrococcaceae bacterium]MDN5813581.1 shikimate kinase [Micrococcaceae bacterium]MDN5823774.1 shikimate kinase [Micrococcaceae bacterium]MDN5879963.1 shikimate kinase [Micrococcaceae bacterium]MDN5887391.1 shikimate kinase [Micrococcaceae bacterium]